MKSKDYSSVNWRVTLMTTYPELFGLAHRYEGGPGLPIQMFGVECGDGWRGIIERMCEAIDAHIKSLAEPIVFEFSQIKEKYGGGRFYHSGGDSVTDKIVSDAENETYETCETCGSTEDVGQTMGWIVVCCKKCMDTNESLMNRYWESNADIERRGTARELVDNVIRNGVDSLDDEFIWGYKLGEHRKSAVRGPDLEKQRHCRNAHSDAVRHYEYLAAITYLARMLKSGAVTINPEFKNFAEE